MDASAAGYFDDLYRQADDPWDLGGRFYERRKRELLLASLPRPRFRRVFEPGCATGLLTDRLRRRCDEVIAWDVAPRALEQAALRLVGEEDEGATVVLERGQIPERWPAGGFDLIVLSEVGYYARDLAQLQQRVDGSLTADGVLVACHWRHDAPDHPSTAHEVHRVVGSGLNRIAGHVEADFLLDVWTRDGVSVATREGVVG